MREGCQGVVCYAVYGPPIASGDRRKEVALTSGKLPALGRQGSDPDDVCAIRQ
jgi:hypothetical protein